jgi:hypothetical protein
MQSKEEKVTAVERLKPERVQEELVERRQKRRRVRASLEGRNGWRLVPGGRALRKVRGFADPREAAAYAAFAVQLAAGRRLPVGLTLSSGQLTVTLESQSGHGITGTMLDLAAELG